MALVQLSATTILNTAQISVMYCIAGQWRVWLSDPTEPLALTDAETAVLMQHLRRHSECWDWPQKQEPTP